MMTTNSPSELTPDTIVMTSPHARTQLRVDGSLEVDTPVVVLDYGPAEAATVSAALSRGEWPQAAGALLGESTNWRRACALLQPAIEAGALRDVTEIVAGTTSAAQLEAYYALCDGWAGDIFTGPFWSLVLSGKASTGLMLGWCEQFYHRTVGADEHNAIAVASCTISEVADELAAHFSQEVGHGEIFLQGLEAAGVPREAVFARPPLPTTCALLEFFNNVARTDTLAYLACYGVLHSPRVGQTLEAVQGQFGALAAAYPGAAAAIRRVGQHAEIDIRAGHDQIVLEPYLLSRAPLSRDETLRVLTSVRGTVGVFIDFFDGILEAYGPHR